MRSARTIRATRITGAIRDSGAASLPAAREASATALREHEGDGTERLTRAGAWLCALAVGISLALRIVYMAQQWRIDASMPHAFLAGEAILGLMARHILQGALPILGYGQYLGGAFEQYLEAAVFALFGSSFTTLRVVPTVFAILWIPLAGAIAARLYGRRAGYLAAALIALPAQFVFEWGFVAWNGQAYLPLLLLAVYLFLTVLERASAAPLALLGLALGVAMWAYQLTFAFAVVFAAAVLIWLRPSRRQLSILALSVALGMAPLVYANIVEPLCTVRNMAARLRASARLSARLAHADPDARFFRSVPLFQVLGMQPRHDGKWSSRGSAAAAVLLAAAAAAGVATLRRRVWRAPQTAGTVLLVAFLGVSVALGFSGFFGQPVARYHLPFYPFLCVLAAGGFALAPRLGIGLAAVIVAGNALQIADPIPVGPQTPRTEVIEALLERGLRHGYGGDNMYDLIFESGEQVIIEPIEWTRYAPYRQVVAAADNVFYLYRGDQTSKESYLVFKRYLDGNGIRYEHLRIGGYHLLYGLTPAGVIERGLDRIRAEIRRRKRTLEGEPVEHTGALRRDAAAAGRRG